MSASSIAIVILAAGSSARMGRPKQLLPYRGRTLLAHAIETALASDCRPVIVVLGSNAEVIRPQIEPFAILVIENRGWSEGIASSIRAGVAFVRNTKASPQAILFMVCDQPRVTPELLARMADAYGRGEGSIIACDYAGATGVPALFDHSHFDELLALRGCDGARGLLRARSQGVVHIPFPGGEIDIDTVGDSETSV